MTAKILKIKASKPSVISNKIFINNGEQIGSAGLAICEIAEPGHYDYRRLLSRVQATRKTPMRQNNVKSQHQKQSEANQDESGDVEKRLRELKKLYAKKLITKPV